MTASPTPASFIDPDAPHGDLAREFLDRLLSGRRAEAVEGIEARVRGGEVSVRDVYLHVFQPILWEVGRLWQVNQIGVAEEHLCSAATQLAMSRLYDLVFAGPRGDRKLVAACAAGDLHEIGIRMVADFFEMEGWRTWYVGADAPIDSFVSLVQRVRPDVVALSATLFGNVASIEACAAAIRDSFPHDRPRILVGGGAFRAQPDLWRRIGADGTADTAAGAIEQVRGWLGDGP